VRIGDLKPSFPIMIINKPLSPTSNKNKQEINTSQAKHSYDELGATAVTRAQALSSKQISETIAQ
jgi:hypothetical protein